MLLPKDDVRAVLELATDRSWTEVKDQLQRISISSPVGAMMFKKPLDLSLIHISEPTRLDVI
eukprot:8585561-Prorocentrum_lima.AAC.1